MLFTNYASLVAIDAGIPLTVPCLHRCSIGAALAATISRGRSAEVDPW